MDARGTRPFIKVPCSCWNRASMLRVCFLAISQISGFTLVVVSNLQFSGRSMASFLLVATESVSPTERILRWPTRATTNYDSLNTNYDSLNTNYDSLNTNYDSLNANYDSLNANYDSLNANYDSLNTNYDSLNTNYDSLNTNYDSLNANYDSLNANCNVIFNTNLNSFNINIL